MNRINIKPLSVNEAWKGRRSKSYKYLNYERALKKLVKNTPIPETNLIAYFEFGFSSKGSDWDNCIKQIQDYLSKVNKFNDNKIYLGLGHKVIVKKGKEYIDYHFTEYTEDKINKIKQIII